MFEKQEEPFWQPDPHFQVVGAVGLLFVFVGVAQGLFMIFASVLALIDSRDLSILLFGVILRGAPPLGHLFVGAVILTLANVGRQGPLPGGGTKLALFGAAFWALLVAGFDLCTCNVLVMPFDLFCLAGALGTGIFLTTRTLE